MNRAADKQAAIEAANKSRDNYLKVLSVLMRLPESATFFQQFVRDAEMGCFTGQSNQTVFNCGYRERTCAVYRCVSRCGAHMGVGFW